MRLVHKLESQSNVAELGRVFKTTSGFGGKSKLITTERLEDSQIRVMKGDSITRYHIRKKYWFEFVKTNITGRTTDKRKLGYIPKVLLRKTGDSIIAAYDESGDFPEQSLYFLFDNQTDLSYKYVLGLLNSRLLTYYYRARSLTNKKSIAQVKKVDLDKIPVPLLNLTSNSDNLLHGKMVQFVESMLSLQAKLATARLPQEKTILQRQIAATDSQIDQLVYQLYDLTPEEIAIVEG